MVSAVETFARLMFVMVTSVETFSRLMLVMVTSVETFSRLMFRNGHISRDIWSPDVGNGYSSRDIGRHTWVNVTIHWTFGRRILRMGYERYESGFNVISAVILYQVEDLACRSPYSGKGYCRRGIRSLSIGNSYNSRYHFKWVKVTTASAVGLHTG